MLQSTNLSQVQAKPHDRPSSLVDFDLPLLFHSVKLEVSLVEE